MVGAEQTRPGEAASLPPGQRPQNQWPVLHYGPVPRFKPERWDLQVYGATADGGKHSWDYAEFQDRKSVV